MAESDIPDPALPPSLDAGIASLLEGLFDPKRLTRLQNALRNANAEGAVVADAAKTAAHRQSVAEPNFIVKEFEEISQAIGGLLLSLVVENAFGVDVDNVAMARLGASSGRGAVAKAITDKMIAGLTGNSTSVEASAQPAANYLAVVLGQVFEAWTISELVEISSAVIPGIDKIEHLADLSDKIVTGLGIPDSSSRVLRPYIDNLVVEPLRRHIAKTYRPNLLADTGVIRAFLRGDYTAAEASEELALLGYSERRMAMLLKDAFKWLSLDDAMHLSRHGIVDDNFVKAQLRAQGYDEPGAEMAFTAAYSKYIQAIQDDSLAAVKAAYVDRRISDGEFETFLSAIYPDDATRAAHEVAARTMRDVNTRRLSSGQVEACVKAGVLAIVDYRVALEREGYPPDDVIALELLLETNLKAGADVEKLRAQKDADAVARQKAKDDADAKKKADAEAAAALKRRGPLAELERAVVRGLIPIARMAEVLTADYDADTVQIYVDDVTGQRADYVANQRKADDAAARAANKGLSLGQLEQAVMDDVLTVQDYRVQLSRFELAPADQQILVATLSARKADNDAAKRKRLDAERRAAAQSINLPTFEQLVRAGVRPLADYDALLSTLGYNDADRAALTALLQQHIDADTVARQLRADTAAANAARGLSLDQFRRAVLLGVKTVDEFGSWLVSQKYTVDAQAVLVAEVRDDVTQADAARAKRDASASSSGAAGVPLATVTRAARLGILSPAQYQAELVNRGYAPDDVALELNLLAAEIANVKTAGALQTSADAGAGGVGLSLVQLAAAVKAGEATLAQYSARATSLGLSDDDVATLTRVLADTLAQTTAAKVRRAQLESTVKPGDVALSVLEQQVRDGALSLDAFAAALVSAGLDTVDVDLLTALLADEGDAGA